jgi:IS66 Orf2 like protein
MIPSGPATRVFVALEPVDMRKGYDGLYGLVTHQLGEDPRSGHLARTSVNHDSFSLDTTSGTEHLQRQLKRSAAQPNKSCRGGTKRFFPPS